MAFSVYVSLTAIFLLSFVSTKKKLHLFEILFIWMIVIIIDHNFLSVTALNLGMFDIPANSASFWTLSLIRIFLFPLLIVWYFDKTFSQKPFKKWIWLPLGIITLTGFEYLADFLNVFKHTRWTFWWSFVEWFVIFLLVNYSWLAYRKLLRRDDA